MNVRRAQPPSAALPRNAGVTCAICPPLANDRDVRARRGLTLQELIVVLVMIGLVGALVLLAGARDTREPAWKVKCGSNLRQIGQAARQYAIDNSGQLPRTRYDPANSTPRFYTNPTATNPFAADGPAPNDVTAAWFLLLRDSDLSAEQFLCPLTEHGPPLRYKDFTGRDDKQSMSNFPGPQFLGYSFANPYPAREAGDWFWTDARSPSFPLAADINPGMPGLLAADPLNLDAKGMRALNSPNHGGEGQNVLFADGSVRFVSTPFEGSQRDNIYTAGGHETLALNPPTGGVAIVSPPLTPTDSVLLPTATGDPVRPLRSPEEQSKRFRRWIGLPGIAVGGAILGIVIVLANRARRRKLARGELPTMPRQI